MGRASWIVIALVAVAARVDGRVSVERTEPDEICVAPIAPPPPAPEAVLESLATAGHHWRIETERGPIHVWTPAGYDATTAATVVFVHGYHTDVDAAWSDDRLEQQFALAGVNAMFVAPSAPAGKHGAIAWSSLDALLTTVTSHVDVQVPTRRVVAVGHSGAYRTLAMWLSNVRLDTVILLDACYREYSFAPWVLASPAHRLVNIAYETSRYSDFMHKKLPETVRVAGLPLEGFPAARILYAKTTVGHYQLVTDGVALPLALRAVELPRLPRADLPLGLSPMCSLDRPEDRDDQ